MVPPLRFEPGAASAEVQRIQDKLFMNYLCGPEGSSAGGWVQSGGGTLATLCQPFAEFLAEESHAQILTRFHDVASRRVDVACQNFHLRRFPAPIGTHEPNAVARLHLPGRIFEHLLVLEDHGHAV